MKNKDEIILLSIITVFGLLIAYGYSYTIYILLN